MLSLLIAMLVNVIVGFKCSETTWNLKKNTSKLKHEIKHYFCFLLRVALINLTIINPDLCSVTTNLIMTCHSIV